MLNRPDTVRQPYTAHRISSTVWRDLTLVNRSVLPSRWPYNRRVIYGKDPLPIGEASCSPPLKLKVICHYPEGHSLPPYAYLAVTSRITRNLPGLNCTQPLHILQLGNQAVDHYCSSVNVLGKFNELTDHWPFLFSYWPILNLHIIFE